MNVPAPADSGSRSTGRGRSRVFGSGDWVPTEFTLAEHALGIREHDAPAGATLWVMLSGISNVDEMFDENAEPADELMTVQLSLNTGGTIDAQVNHDFVGLVLSALGSIADNDAASEAGRLHAQGVAPGVSTLHVWRWVAAVATALVVVGLVAVLRHDDNDESQTRGPTTTSQRGVTTIPSFSPPSPPDPSVTPSERARVACSDFAVIESDLGAGRVTDAQARRRFAGVVATASQAPERAIEASAKDVVAALGSGDGNRIFSAFAHMTVACAEAGT